jgi:zinc protease
MKNRHFFPARVLLAACLCLVAVNRGHAQSAKPQAATVEPIKFSEESLPNGLRVIYAPLHQAPVVHVRVLYHVGSRDEKPDRQGFAHMFEHMMFRGSAHVKPEEHMKLIGVVGGNSNAFTNFDQTVYVNTLPSNQLEMALYLEADRMASFKVDENIFATERKVVAEEWRMRLNRPYGNVFELFLDKAFTKHPYKWTPIGNMDHLKAARVNELQEFFNKYYLPNNAILVISGDFEDAKAKELVRKYFGWIPAGPEPKRDIPAEPQQTQARMTDSSQGVPLPMILIGYHIPEYASDDHYALAALDNILGVGGSSRLDRLLVHGKEPMCVGSQTIHWQGQDSGMFGIGGVVMAGKDAGKVKDMLNGAIADIVKNGVTDDELAKAKKLMLDDIINGRKTADQLASELGDEALFVGNAARVNEAPAKIAALTVSEIKRVAAKYFSPERSTTLEIKPSMMAAISAKAESSKAEAVKSAPVAPSTAPVKTRVIEFPKDYPTKAPMAPAGKTPEFAKGVESQINDVRTIVMTDHRLPLVRWSLTMRRGSHSDPKGKAGLAALTGDMLRRGAGNMSFDQLNADLDSRGIDIGVSDGGDHTRLTGDCTTDQLEHGFHRTRDMLLTPSFPEDEFKKAKQQMIESLVLNLDSPNGAAGLDMDEALYGDSPLGRSATPESVKSITLDDVKKFYKDYYHSNDAILMISGDVSPEQGQALAKQLTEGWTAGPMLEVEYGKLPEPRRKIILIDRPAGQQATVQMGIPAYTNASDEKFAGSVAGQILTAGIDSRLGKYVRAEKGLAYGVHGVFQPGRQAGAFMAGTDTAVESTADAITAIFKVLNDMRTAPVTAQELAEAQQRVAGGMVMSMQTVNQQASFRADGILNGYPIDYYDKYPARIAAVTPAQVQDVVKKYVNEGEMVIVVVAPAASVKEQLEKLGEVEVRPMPAQRKSATPAKKAA